jgi:sensor histidine kinase YesM
MRQRWLLAGGFWTFVALLYTLQLAYVSRQTGEDIVLRTALVAAVSYYLCWIPVTVATWTISRDWVPGAMRVRALAVRHFGLGLVMVLLHSTVTIFITLYLVRHLFTGVMVRNQYIARLIPGLLVYAAVAGVGVALSYYARWREREMTAARLEAQLSEARLQSLKAQLHPHFLFNSLHAVASLIRTGDDAGAIRTIAGLSDLLRRVLDADTRPLVPLSEEAGFIERYFEIQRVRFGDRLRTSLEIEAGTENVQVPAMLLQPLVENAFRHGLADRVEAGEIIVRAKRAGDRLELVVEDNGQGLPQDWNRADRAGIGLKTTAARLEHVYRSSAEFHVEPRDGGGTRVTIRVPA